MKSRTAMVRTELLTINELLQREIAERTKAEAALKEANEEWLNTFNAAADPIILLDTNHRIKRANKAMAVLLGLPAEKIAGQTCHELIHGSKEPIVLCPQSKVLRDGQSHFEEIYEPRVGKHFRVSVSPIFNAMGEMTGSIHFIHDITDRVRAEHELKEMNEMLEERVKARTAELQASEERLELATGVAKEAIWDVDLINGITHWNQAYGEMFDRAPSEHHHAECWMNRIHPEDRERVVDSFNRALVDGTELWSCDYRMRVADGSYAFLEDRAIMVRDKAGKVVRAVGAKLDVTEKKCTEEALRKSEEKFRLLANTMPGLVWTARPDGKVDYRNRCTFDYTGLERIEKGAALHPDDRAVTAQAWRKAVKAGIGYQWEHRIRRFDGEYRWFLSRGVPLRDDEGAIVKWYGTSIDINDLHEAHQKINAMTQELMMAEERERSRIAGELHDHVAPNLLLCMMKINSISSQVQPGGDERVIEEVEELLDQSVQEIRSLTFQLRPPILANVGLAAALKWLAEEYRGKYGLEVKIVDDNPQQVLEYGICSTLFQIIRELLLNIVKHAGTKSADISIQREAEKIIVSVGDGGAGFDVSAVDASRPGANGFGLFNIHQKIKYLGGHICFDSTPGEGTLVTMSVPVGTIENDQESCS